MSALHQDVYWITREGELVALEDMSPRWRRNVQWYLRAHAVTLLERRRQHEWLASVGSGGYGGGDEWDYPTKPSRDEALEWLEATPLMRRLCDLIATDLIERQRVGAS